MNTTAVTMFDQKALPAHLADFAEETNIVVRERIPQLSFRGKVWRVVVDGEENIVNKPGTDDPASVVAGVILDYNKARSRAFFAGAYVDGQSSAPTCWSHDGVTPHESVKEKQAPTCASCPQSAKGSKITDAGKETTACSQFKRAAFVPLANIKHTPLLLKIPQTSIWDKDAEAEAAKGFFAFDQYLDMLKRNRVMHTAQVVTKIKFDPRTAYPKLLFGPLDWLPSQLTDDVKAHLADKDNLNTILNVDPEGLPAAAETAAGGAPAVAPATGAPKTPAPAAKAPAPAKPAEEDDDAALMGQFAAPAAAPVKPAAAAKAAVAKAAAKPAAAAKAAPAPAAEVVTADNAKADGIGDLLSAWADE